jgi:hypothetical protein
MLDFLAHRLLPIWRLAERQRALVPLVVVLGLVGAAFEGLGVGLVIPLLAMVTGAAGVGGSAIVDWLHGFGADMAPPLRIVVIALAMFILIALRNAVAFANHALGSYISGQVGHRVRSELTRSVAARILCAASGAAVRGSGAGVPPGLLPLFGGNLRFCDARASSAQGAQRTCRTVVIRRRLDDSRMPSRRSGGRGGRLRVLFRRHAGRFQCPGMRTCRGVCW